MFCGSQNYWHFCNSELTDFVFIKFIVFDFWIYFVHFYARSVFENFSIRKLKKPFSAFLLENLRFVLVEIKKFRSHQLHFNRIRYVWNAKDRYNLFQYAPARPLTRFKSLDLTRFNSLQTDPTLSIRLDSVHSNPLLTTRCSTHRPAPNDSIPFATNSKISQNLLIPKQFERSKN